MLRSRFCRTTHLLIIASTLLASANAGRGETAAERDERTRWFRDAKFGLFIHWGVYSILGKGEWIMDKDQISVAEYEKLPPQFNPVKFNAAEWVQLAQDAGQKYIVITTKHHDGFCLFDSKLTDYDTAKTPYGRDIIKMLSDECHKRNVRIGYYYSIMDWRHPDYLPRRKWEATSRPATGAQLDRYLAYMRGQLRELLTGYGNVACIWFDYGYEHKPDVLHSSEIVAEMRSIQPKLLVNDRAGTPEDFGTPEQFVPATGIVNPDGSTRLWEACITMTSRWWGYDAEEKNFKSTTDLIRMLVDVVSKGGNLLLNVGPRPDGTIQPEFVERLQGIGRWMRVHGDAIYGTTASPFRVLPFFGRCTVKGNRLFVHVFAWPADRKLRLPGLLNTIKQASLLPALTSGLPVGHEGRDAIITLPEKPYDEAANVVVLDLDGPPRIEFVAIRPDPQGGIAMPMMSAELRAEFGQKARFETHEGQVHLGYWVRKQDHPAWTFQVDKPGEYSVELVYGAPAGSAGNTVEVAVGDRKVTAKVEPTANPLDFQTRAVGRIACRAGENVLTVRPVGEVKDIVMNLRAAILRPVPPATTSAPTTSPATTRP